MRIAKRLFPVFYGLLGYLTVRLINDTISETKIWERWWVTNLLEIIMMIIMGYAMVGLIRLAEKRFQKATASTDKWAVFREFFRVYSWLFLLINLVLIPFAEFTDDGAQVYDVVVLNIVPTLYFLLYFAIVRGNYYLKEYVSNQVKLEKLKTDKVNAELKFLKAQLQPHSLFNALNTIYFQMDESVEGAKKTVENLSELLRYQLYDNKEELVAVSVEWLHVMRFIEIYKLRLSEKLKLEITYDATLDNYKIPPVLLFPLIENAFKYVGAQIVIKINAQFETNKLLFSVYNTKNPNSTIKPGGIGLENLRKRLELIYPDKHQLQINTSPEEFYVLFELQLV